MTARAEAFQPGHLTRSVLASRRHWLNSLYCLILYSRDVPRKAAYDVDD